MDPSLQKFNQLPPEIKDRLSAPAVLKTIEDLERKYQIKLTMVFIKAAVRDLPLETLEKYLMGSFKITQAAAEEIKNDFFKIFSRLGFNQADALTVNPSGRSVDKSKFSFSAESTSPIGGGGQGEQNLSPLLAKEGSYSPPLLTKEGVRGRLPTSSENSSEPPLNLPLTKGEKNEPAPIIPLPTPPSQPLPAPFASFIAKQTQSPKTAAAPSVSFDKDDEAEVSNLAVFESDGLKQEDYENLAEKIIKNFNYQESDGVLIKRLKSVISSRLRDARDDLETIEVLTKSKKIGGLELTIDQANNLLKLIKQVSLSTPPSFSPSFPIPPLTKGWRKQSPDTTSGRSAGGVLVAPTIAKTADLSYNKIDSTASDALSGLSKTLPPAEDILPIIEEEDGLPVLKFSGASLNNKNQVPAGPTTPTKTFPLAKKIADWPEKAPKKVNQPAPAASPTESLTPPVSQSTAAEDRINRSAIIPPSGGMPAKLANLRAEVIAEIEKSSPTAVVASSPPLATSSTQPPPSVLPPAKPEPFLTAGSPAPKNLFTPGRRPSLDDVKFVKKLMSPVEELENLTLIDFRRLASPDAQGRQPLNPGLATKIIKEKIDLLEKEKFGKKLEGISAWHNSEVCRFYRLLGQTAMQQGRGVENIIKDRQTNNKPTLTWEEFEAVMELNKDLRY